MDRTIIPYFAKGVGTALMLIIFAVGVSTTVDVLFNQTPAVCKTK